MRIQQTNNVEASVEAMQDGGSIPPASTYRKGNMTEYKKCIKCTKCKIEKPSTDEFFYRSREKKNGWKSHCKECYNAINRPARKKARNNRKQRLVDHLGGKCTICGYDKCLAAFDFHHTNPKDKKFELSAHLTKQFDELLEEAKKCTLLCSNCHRELHAVIGSGRPRGRTASKEGG